MNIIFKQTLLAYPYNMRWKEVIRGIKIIGFGLTAITVCTCCDAIRGITATYHDPKIETKESVIRFVNQHRMDGYPILSCNSLAFELPLFPFTFNAKGQYLSLDQKKLRCPDKQAYVMAIKYIMEHGDETFITDSVTNQYRTIRDPDKSEYIMKEMRKNTTLSKDSSLWVFHTETHLIHLDNFSPYFTTLEGSTVDVKLLYREYVVFQVFTMGGRPNLTGIVVRRLIKDVKALNKENGHRLQLILINGDRLDWMEKL